MSQPQVEGLWGGVGSVVLNRAGWRNFQSAGTLTRTSVNLRAEIQENQIADEVSALIAVVRPILVGLLGSLKDDVVSEVGGVEKVKLKMLPRLRRPGDGDCGICFEYAVMMPSRASSLWC